MNWIIFIIFVLIAYKFFLYLGKRKMNNATKDFFKNSELTTSSVRGFLKGLKVNPLEENKIIEDCKINNDKISRKKLIIWIVGFMENQKQGLGRDFLEKSGFNSLDEIE